MSSEIVIFLAYGVSFLLVFLFGKMLLLPVKKIGKLLMNSVLGTGLLALINIVGSTFSFGIPINILNSLIVGMLGVPGVLMLAICFLLH
ncbi:MAG: pro-sigmaK processing inhibitor BofA family protein [Firmicutes bacterium]|nr:pro-sigmaK processing inhibitor BofA family protein [Bacillota bacterium]